MLPDIFIKLFIIQIVSETSNKKSNEAAISLHRSCQIHAVFITLQLPIFPYSNLDCMERNQHVYHHCNVVDSLVQNVQICATV